MPQEYGFTFPLPAGLHARPASFLRAVADRFGAATLLVNGRTGAAANAKSVLSMVGLDVRQGDPCVLRADGPDESAAIAALSAFVRDDLPGCDEQAPVAAPVSAGEVELPRSLRGAGLDRFLRGTPVSPGVGIGSAVIVGGITLPPELATAKAGPPDVERRAFADAVLAVRQSIDAQAKGATNKQEAEVLAAHAALADDVALAERVEAEIAAGRTAAQAVLAAGDHYAAQLQASPSAYLRERAADVQDVAGQLLSAILGEPAAATAVALAGPSIVFAEQLTPGQFLGLHREHLRGLVLAHGGQTSHVVILARSMGVPTVVGVDGAARAVRPGQRAVVDAGLGIVVVEPSEAVDRYFGMERQRLAATADRLAATRDEPGRTADGRSLEVGVNVASAEEVGPGVANGAQGVGLFRTEMIFMDREAAPTEDEQFAIYRRAAEGAAGRPVILRLLDAGGDKPVPYLNLPTEANPFLGYRAVRFYAEFAPLIRSQLRAILRAAAFGDVRILVPMVCCVEEVRAVRAMVAEAAAELSVAVPPLGIMVEVPSVAFIMDQLCDEVDFFSIGSNDLTQYTLAADRDNARVASLYSWAHPSVLRLLKTVVDGAHARGKWVGLCGELADVPAALPVLVGLGLDEISASGPRIPAVKAAIGGLRFDACAEQLAAALACRTRAEVEAALASTRPAAALPMLAVDQLHLDADATTKAEAIKLLTDGLGIAGRADQPRAVEEAVWRREETYSTGFGHGFAVPHCKSPAVGASTVAIARLRQPVEWGSLDGEPVDVVILLAIRDGGGDTAKEHMRIFAKLSRLVMRDEFRDGIRAAATPADLYALLAEQLGL
jgi:phosphoenolpyruvate-protein phosphotransferase